MSRIRKAGKRLASSQGENVKDKRGQTPARTAKQASGVRESFGVWDAARHLRTDEEMVAYLDACMEEGDPELVCAALGDIARARNMSQLARDTGMTREGLYKALSLTGNPSFATVLKVSRALGLRLAFVPASS